MIANPRRFSPEVYIESTNDPIIDIALDRYPIQIHIVKEMGRFDIDAYVPPTLLEVVFNKKSLVGPEFLKLA